MLKNPRQEAFAAGIVAGKSATKSYTDAGYAETGAAQSAVRLLRNPSVSARIAELRAEIGSKLEKNTIRDLSQRLSAYQDRWDRMRRVIDERAATYELVKVPGGGTGLLVKTLRAVGSTFVEEYAVDTGLLREMRELELQAAKELGQFEEKHQVNGSLVDRLNAARKRLRESDED